MNAQTILEQRRVGDHPATTAGPGRGIRDSRESPKDRALLEPPRRGSAGREPAAHEQEREQSMSHAPRAESTLHL